MESDLKKEMKKIFPLKVSCEGIYLGMGENGTRYRLTTNNGDKICFSDFEPNKINDINLIVNSLIETME